MASRRARRVWLLGGAAAVVLVIVVVVALLATQSSGNIKPPPLSGGPDVFRVTVPSSPGIPAVPVAERLTDGSVVGLSLWDISTVDGRQVGTITVQPPGMSYDDTHPVKLAAGATEVVGGFRVQVLHLWQMPDASNDAADIKVTPGS